jgi:uncharacterized protein with von Willebrand factor type A (vWA) domain
VQHVVIVVDVSIAMAMRDLFDAARDVARRVAAVTERSPDHRLVAVIAVSSDARLISHAQLSHLTSDFRHGIDLDAALDLARHELAGRDGRVVLISSLDCHVRHADGGHIAIATPESLAAGREVLAAWLDRGLPLDLLLCSSDQGRVHGERVRRVFADRGATIVDLEDGVESFETYLHTYLHAVAT